MMPIEDWVAFVSEHMPAEARRRGIDLDVTRTQAFGLPCNLLTAVRMPCHDRDEMRDVMMKWKGQVLGQESRP